ncbi:MAG: DNA pilot protein [Microviridae sp.]|nr:MAG: DNA pilot protein [Microviridae sp.]
MIDPNTVGMIASAGANLGGSALGLVLNKTLNREQLKQQGRMQEQQMAGQMKLNEFNQQLGMKTWEETGYGAQMKQMEGAGLNPGLMYGMGGGGSATTASGGSQTVSGGQASQGTGNVALGLQMASQTALMAAQIDNIKADTANKRAQIPGHEGIPDVQKAGITKDVAQTNVLNEEAKGKALENRITEVRARLTEAGESNTLGILNEEYNKIKADVALTNEMKNKAAAEIATMGVSQTLMKSGVLKNQQEIKESEAKIAAIIAGVQQKYTELENSGQQININKGQLLLEGLRQQFTMDTYAADQIVKLGSMILGGAMMGASKNVQK